MNVFNLQTAPISIVGTLGVILLAHVFYNTTIVIRLVGNAISHLDPRLEQAASTLGADHPGVLRRVTLPLLRPSIMAATLLVFIFDFTSFGVILLLGGPGFSTLEVEIYKQAIQIFNLPLAGSALPHSIAMYAGFFHPLQWNNKAHRGDQCSSFCRD